MCGIARFYHLPPLPMPADRLLGRMIRALRHRGPDGHGLHVQVLVNFLQTTYRFDTPHEEIVPENLNSLRRIRKLGGAAPEGRAMRIEHWRADSARFPRKRALVAGARRLKYAELEAGADRLARALCSTEGTAARCAIR
jgi:hypothetical protein